jgi:hypothetical protein
MFTGTTRSFLGGNHGEVNKRKQKFENQQTRKAYNNRLGPRIEAIESTAEPEDVMMAKVTWMQPYLAYMINKTLPEDVVEAQRIV